jgi:hypothetical protein
MPMPFPTHPLRKADVRSLLVSITQPTADNTQLSPPARRNAIAWAKAAHLLDDQGLTAEGQLIATKDPYLETTVTDWVLHFHLSLKDNSLWHHIVYEFLPQHSSFTQEDLIDHCIQTFILEPPDKIRKSVKIIQKTYLDSSANAKSKFLVQDKKRYSVGQPDLSNSYTTGYLLAKLWEQHFKSQQAVLVDQIVDPAMGLALILGIQPAQLRQQLDNLAAFDIIEQRSAKPHLTGIVPQVERDTTASYQVIRRWENPVELLEKAYENDIATPNRPLIQSLAGILDDDDGTLSQLFEWASELMVLDGGSKTMIKLAS